MIERRTFLLGSGAIVVAFGGAGVALALQGSEHRSPRRPLKALDAASFSVLAAVADAICPGTDGLPSAWDLEVPEDVDAFLASNHPAVASEIIQGLTLLENGLPGLLLDLQPRPFTTRSLAARDATLSGMATSRIALRRTLYKGLLGLVTTTYWGNPATFAHSGYRPMDFTGYEPPPQKPEEPEEPTEAEPEDEPEDQPLESEEVP